MNIREFSVLNRRRCESSNGFNHPIKSWSLSDWMTATLGELGEAANIVKKLNRVRDGIKGNAETDSELRAALADELADAYTYLDLTAQAAGIDLESAVLSKFGKVSARIGYEDALLRRSHSSAVEMSETRGAVIAEIAAERRRQVEAEGWTPEHDDAHTRGELAFAAVCYADPLYREREQAPLKWPWDARCWKPKDRRRDLIRAAALLVAEIERLDRAAEQGGAG